jgi:uncharacterized protein (TIGR03435 family)
MSLIQILTRQPWVQHLGLTLLHFLWQGAIVACIYAAARQWDVRDSSPNRRYLLACAALSVLAIAPVVTWMLLQGPSPQSVADTFAAPMSATRTESIRSILFSPPSDTYPAMPGSFLSWVVAFWLIGASVFSLRLMGGWILAERLRRAMTRPASAEWQLVLDRLKARISVSRPVRLLVSGLIQAPAAIGWFRPIVLVPVGSLVGLSSSQIEALLLHELAHIRRNDYLVHIWQSAIEAVFFYHPAVWWISGHMRAERELCCDDLAVSITGDGVIYARALAELDSARFIQPAVMAANGGSLSSRIARLLGESRTLPRTSGGMGTAVALVLLMIGTWALFAQPTARPQFEVASIKPSLNNSLMNVRPFPGRLTADATLQILVQYGYGVQPFQVAGGPAWIQSDRYQVEAKADGSASRDQVFLMLKSLLEDRFQLKTHRDMKEQPVFALVPAKGGLKLPPPKEGVCVDSAVDAPAEWAGTGRMAAPGEVQPTKGRCGSALVALGPRGAQIKGGKITMRELVRTLSTLLGRGVIDKTGFTGLFDLQLDFVPDETTPAMPPPPDARILGLSLPEALRQQLGLQAESAKGPVEVIVVDHAERPSQN